MRRGARNHLRGLPVSRGDILIFSRTYDIERFWCPVDGKYALDRWGFLQDPLDTSVWSPESDVVPFEQIQDVPVLILLGEPGAGKSRWFQHAEQKTIEDIRSSGNQGIWIDLGHYEAAEETINAVFRHSDFVEWVRGKHRLQLFLDGFDECHSRVDVLPKRFLSELRRQPIERLCLRIMCRTSEWPQNLEKGLLELWDERFPIGGTTQTGLHGKGQSADARPVQSFELMPFRREDVTAILSGEHIEPETFLSEIQSRQLVPFALTPQTLAFLAKMYRTTGRLPDDLVELYREGCLELCREHNPDRIDGRLTSPYQTDELYAVASRIAALTIFCDRHTILRNDARPEDGELSLRDICYGHENVNGQDMHVGEDIVRDTLNTGLFNGRTGGRMGWAHLTYPEFLAADYLHRNNLTTDHMKTLMRHASGADKKTPPQLRETATWLAAVNQDFLDLVMETEPEILLTKRPHLYYAGDKELINERLVKNLLQSLDGGRVLDSRISYMRLGCLQHPRLGDQLTPYITDRVKNFVVRRVAIRIAEENDVRELQDPICDVALDPEQDDLVRQPAAHALIRLADNHVKSRLKYLIQAQGDDDPDDELKGCALTALWPAFMTAGELFGNLTVPKNPDLFGAYAGFLEWHLVDNMSVSDLPEALEWVQRQPESRERATSFRKIINSMMIFAYDHFDYPAVLQQFARAAHHRLGQYEEIMTARSEGRKHNILFADDARRRHLVKEMLTLASNSKESAIFEAHILGNLVDHRDFSWLLELFQSQKCQKTMEITAFLVARLFETTNAEEFEAVYSLSINNKALADAIQPSLGPVDLESEEASRGRRRLQLEQERTHKPAQEQTSLDEDAILMILEAIEAGNLLRFVNLCWRMVAAEPGKNGYALAKLRSWEACNTNTKERFIQAAVTYITESNPTAWVSADRIDWAAIAGCIAFSLILRVPIRSSRPLPASIWVKWAPIIVACGGILEDESIIAEAYARVPDQIICSILNQIDYENSRDGYIFITEKLHRFWDTELTQAMLNKLGDTILKANAIEAILNAISKHDIEAAEGFAKSKLSVPIPARARERMLALVAGKFLMLHFSEESWPTVWHAIAGARLFGRKLLSIVDANFGLRQFFEKMTEDDLATLYIWISREYPSLEEALPHKGSRSPNVQDIRERILANLQNRGTVASVQALRTLSSRLPGQAERRRWIIDFANERVLAATWMPWRPDEVLGMIQDHQKRLVQTGDQLLEVVIESVSRFEKSLHDELPAMRDLWDLQVKQLHGSDQASDTWIPVNENTLSDRIARHLRSDLTERGIIISREVRIRPGDLTDIHVDAIIREPSSDRIDLVKVIIEVKGCWNDGLENDMAGQLLGRYMTENNCSHGLYLIGWFQCDSWDKRDYRSQRPSKGIVNMTIDEAKTKFNGQAETLTAQSGKALRAFVLNAGRR
jgi:hypothetical protein